MSTQAKQKAPVVCREYRAADTACVQALALLLKTSVRKQGGPDNRPDDGTKSKEDSADGPIIQQSA